MSRKKFYYIKKIIMTLNELEILDSKLINKYNKNQQEICLYTNILLESNNNFSKIINNLETNIN